MGKGDKKSRRGKIVRGTHGVRRPRKKKKNSPVVEPKAAKVSKTVKKAAEPVVKEVTEEKPVAKKTAAKAKKKETPVVELPEKPEPEETPAEEKPAQEDQAGE